MDWSVLVSIIRLPCVFESPTNQSIQLQCFSCLRSCICVCVCVCSCVLLSLCNLLVSSTRGGQRLICNVACKWPRHLVTPVRIQFYISAWYWSHWQVMTGYSTKCAWLMIYCGYFVKIWEGVEQDESLECDWMRAENIALCRTGVY